MKLIRFGAPGKERPGILDAAGNRRSVARFFRDFDEKFFENDGLTKLKKFLEKERQRGTNYLFFSYIINFLAIF